MSSSSALLPIPGMVKTIVASPAVDAVAAPSRWVESSMTSTSGRPAAAKSSFADALVSELEAARRRAAELEVRLRQAAAESQAWCGMARSNEVVAGGLRATLDHLLRAAGAPPPVEGFGDSDSTSPAAADDAESCFFAAKEAAKEDDAASSQGGKWACKCCGEREASALLWPCRHLCLCKACEPKLDSCPVCLAAKSASIHVAMN